MKEKMDKRIEYLKTVTIQELLYLDTAINKNWFYIFTYPEWITDYLSSRLAKKATKQYKKIQADIALYEYLREIGKI